MSQFTNAASATTGASASSSPSQGRERTYPQVLEIAHANSPAIATALTAKNIRPWPLNSRVSHAAA